MKHFQGLGSHLGALNQYWASAVFTCAASLHTLLLPVEEPLFPLGSPHWLDRAGLSPPLGCSRDHLMPAWPALSFTSANQWLVLDPIQPNEAISGFFWSSGMEKLSPWDHGLGIMLVWRCQGPCCREVCWEGNPQQGKGRELVIMFGFLDQHA